MVRIIVSQGHADTGKAVTLADWLGAQGFDDVVLDRDCRDDSTAPERLRAALDARAQPCEALLFLVSRTWLDAPPCLAAFELALHRNKRLIGAVVDETALADIPDTIKGEAEIIRLRSQSEAHGAGFSADGLKHLKDALRNAALGPRSFAWPPPEDADRAPYPGLRPMEMEDAGVFFGRDNAIAEALDRLRGLSRAGTPQLFALLGDAGAGKSSFLWAGLVPRLARDKRRFLPLPVVRPGRAAISGSAGLLSCLRAAARAQALSADLAHVENRVAGGPESLGSLLDTIAEAARARSLCGQPSARPPVPVLAIDQAEEMLLPEGAEEATALLTLLGTLMQTRSTGLILILAANTRAFPLLQSTSPLQGLRATSFDVEPLSREAYEAIIEGPARRHALHRPLAIEPALTPALCADAAAVPQGEALPLLAFALERLYREGSGGGVLRLSDYEGTARMAGAISAAETRALAEAEPDAPGGYAARLAQLRQSLIPLLVRIDAGTAAPRRRVAFLSEIPADARPLVARLAQQGLLTANTNKQTGETCVELAHAALLRHWALVNGYLEAAAAARTALDGVQQAAREWAQNAKADGWLSHRGERLAAAERAAARADLGTSLQPDARAYLAACRNAQAAAARRQRRRSALLTYGSLAAALALAVTGYVLFEQWQQALRSESLLLSDLARQTIEEGDAVTGTLLALEALPDRKAGSLVQALRPYVPAAQRSLDMANSPGTWRDRLLKGHAAPVISGAFSADGSLIVTASRDGTARIWEAESGTLRATLAGHLGAVLSTVFSPDDSRVITTSADATARVWDAATGALLATLQGHKGPVRQARFSSDGARIVTGADDATARIWEATTGSPIATLNGHAGRFTSAQFSSDGTRILTTALDGTARLWQAATGKPISILSVYDHRILSAAFSPDGKRILTTSDDKGVRIWDGHWGVALAVLAGHSLAVRTAAFSPDGTRFATGSDDRTARVWDTATGQALAVLEGHQAGVSRVGFSADGARVLTASRDHTARMWEAETGKPQATLKGHQGALTGAVFSPDGPRVLTTSEDGTARVWSRTRGVEVASFNGHALAILSAAFSPDGRRIVTASQDGTARLWNSGTGRPVSVLKGHRGHVQSAAFSPDGRHIITTSVDKTARIWQADTGAEIATLAGHKRALQGAAFSPAGHRVVTASWDGTAKIWDAATGALLATLRGHDGPVESAVFSPDGTRVLTASEDGTARVWSAATGAHIATLKGHRRALESAAFSPRGRLAVTASQDKTARIWDTVTGSPGPVLSGHEDALRSARFSPDGKHVLTTSWDGTARIWNVRTGAAVATLKGASETSRKGVWLSIRSAVYDPDGARIVTTSWRDTAQIWDTATASVIAELDVNSGFNVTAQFSPDGQRVLTASESIVRIWEAPGIQTLVDRNKRNLGRCLLAEQREKFHLSPAVPRWCYTMRKWPYHDPANTPLPPRWYEKPFREAYEWLTSR